MFPALGKRRQEDSPGSMADQSNTVKEFHVPGRDPNTHTYTYALAPRTRKKKNKKQEHSGITSHQKSVYNSVTKELSIKI